MRPRAAGLRAVTAALLVTPACASATAAAEPGATDGVPPEAVVGVVPFEGQGERNRIYLNLAPEGNRPLVWLLDTGAQGSVMTPRAARAAGVSVRRTKDTPYVRATRLGRDVRFWIDTRHSDTGSRTGGEYALLGGDFLEEFVVEIDFPGRTVRFIDPKLYAVPEEPAAPGARVVPLRIDGKRPFVDVEIGGREVSVLLDTGAPTDLVLSGRAAKQLGIDWKGLPDFGRYGSTVGPVEVRLHETQELRLAGFEFGPMPVVVAPRGWYNIGGNTDSALGFDLLAQFVVRLDYRRRRMWLERTGDPTVTYLGVRYDLTRRSGAILSADASGYDVVGIFPESPAARLGLLPGDRPLNAAGSGPLDIVAFLESVAAGEEVTVARRRGEVWIDVILPEPTAEGPAE